MATVYLETSFVSATVTSRTDPASIYRRGVSQQWWQTQRHLHQPFVSEEVQAELSSPRYPLSTAALQLIAQLPILPITPEVRGFAVILVHERLMPSPVAGDAIHVALACVHGIDYVLSWNVRHLANVNKQTHLQTICLRYGLTPPRIVTPDVLWEIADEPPSPSI